MAISRALLTSSMSPSSIRVRSNIWRGAPRNGLQEVVSTAASSIRDVAKRRESFIANNSHKIALETFVFDCARSRSVISIK